MNGRLLKKLSLDAFMIVLILLEFAYQLTGSTIHELIGMSMLGFIIVHAKWNWQWFLSLFKGRYTGIRRTRLTVNVLLLAATLMMMGSGLLNSTILFLFLNVEFELLSREFHTAAAYWFLILMAVHLGLHWRMVMAEAGNLAGLSGGHRLRTVLLRAVTAIVVVHGVYASFERNLLGKLTAYYSFDHWDFKESIIGFFAQYVSIVGLYVCLAYCTLRCYQRRRSRSTGNARIPMKIKPPTPLMD